LSGLICEDLPLIGIEPSAILGFRDEYPDLCGEDLSESAAKIARNSYMVDEFIAMEYNNGRIDRHLFVEEKSNILLHAHCQQKAVASSKSTLEMLSIPVNYSVVEIPSGCCGMAGSFGYEKEHFDLSNKIGELVLFPAIRNSEDNITVLPGGFIAIFSIKVSTKRIK
jgi:Fe-S oxidoreductase